MYRILTALFVFTTVLGLSAGSAQACDCPDNNNINVENNNNVVNNNNVNNSNTNSISNKNKNYNTNKNYNKNNNTNNNTNTNNNNSNAEASSSANAQATSNATAAATGGNSDAQGGNASTSTSVSISGDENPASSAAPVYLTSSNDTCMGSTGVGGQGMTFGFSIGSTWTDKNCVMLKNAREMKNQGHDKAAKIRLCMDEDNAIAFEAAGDPCPRALKTAQRAAAMMKDKRIAVLAPVADKSQAGDVKSSAAVAAFMLEPGNRVFFGFDKAEITPKAQETLDKQAAWLKENETVRVLIEGHADERGSSEYNLALGERRAIAVKQYLIGKGVATDRVETVSFGKDRPAVTEASDSAWSQNRRTVTQIIPPKKNIEGGQVSRLPGQPDTTQLAAGGMFQTALADATDGGMFQSALADVTDGAE